MQKQLCEKGPALFTPHGTSVLDEGYGLVCRILIDLTYKGCTPKCYWRNSHFEIKNPPNNTERYTRTVVVVEAMYVAVILERQWIMSWRNI